MAANPDVRWRQRLQSFRKAFDQNEDTANEIAEAILARYVQQFEKFLLKFTELQKQQP